MFHIYHFIFIINRKNQNKKHSYIILSIVKKYIYLDLIISIQFWQFE